MNAWHGFTNPKSIRLAIQQFRAHHPDVTLMDLQMPEMNGLDAVMAIRGELPEARIDALTQGDVDILRLITAGNANKPKTRDVQMGDVSGRHALQCLNVRISTNVSRPERMAFGTEVSLWRVRL